MLIIKAILEETLFDFTEFIETTGSFSAVMNSADKTPFRFRPRSCFKDNFSSTKMIEDREIYPTIILEQKFIYLITRLINLWNRKLKLIFTALTLSI